MRLHFIFGFLVIIAGIYFNLNYMELILLLFAITFVLIAEMVNTVFEYFADVIAEEKYHPVVKVIKDISAGAVFVTVVNAALTGYLLVARRVDIQGGKLLVRIQQSPFHVTLITFLVTIGLVLVMKLVRKEKDLLRGGMPSGHAAVAFAAWMVITLVSLNPLISILVFFLAFLVARSRLYAGIHSMLEVVSGAVLGALVALLIWQVLL